MAYEPFETMVNGKPSPWNSEIRELWAIVVAAHFDGETRTVAMANYFTPRPYVDQYNRGSDKSGFVYRIGRDVCYHNFSVGAKGGAG